VAVAGTLDGAEPATGELDVAAARSDGSPTFSPLLQGGAAAGLYSVVTAGELLLLACRLLARLPSAEDAASDAADTPERAIDV
jgi:hypothetical protein